MFKNYDIYPLIDRSEIWIIRWQYIMEYSKEINSLLGNPKPSPNLAIEDQKTVLKVNLYLWMVPCIYKCTLALCLLIHQMSVNFRLSKSQHVWKLPGSWCKHFMQTSTLKLGSLNGFLIGWLYGYFLFITCSLLFCTSVSAVTVWIKFRWSNDWFLFRIMIVYSLVLSQLSIQNL